MFVIHDRKTGQFYRNRPANGWYGPLNSATRIYATQSQADQTIREAGHHVSYPGDRDLEVLPVRLELV